MQSLEGRIYFRNISNIEICISLFVNVDFKMLKLNLSSTNLDDSVPMLCNIVNGIDSSLLGSIGRNITHNLGI